METHKENYTPLLSPKSLILIELEKCRLIKPSKVMKSSMGPDLDKYSRYHKVLRHNTENLPLPKGRGGVIAARRILIGVC